MIKLYPRLSRPEAKALFQTLPENPLGKTEYDMSYFSPSGGSKATQRDLKRVQEGVIRIAEKHGYIGSEANGSGKSDFDTETSIFLWNQIGENPEALKDEMWSFFALILLPEIVIWRFGRKLERFEGGIRNTFQRLWVRGRILDRGEAHDDRWALLSALGEDALVGITERPSIGADPVLAKAVAEGWIRARKKYGNKGMENRMRNATIRIRINNVIQMMSVLDDQARARVIDAAFSD